MIRFLPSYVGSKAYWLSRLEFLLGEYIVELFCGSSVISANYAYKAILNDIDLYLYKILKNYNNLIVPKIFTKEDYLKIRGQENWWRYCYCLQKMSFSGVFRYSKNGYNVPIKKNLNSINIINDYLVALKRYNKLNPLILNLDYRQVKINVIEKAIIILDPPYENSKTAYNKKFDYHFYWEYVYQLEGNCKKLIIFDSIKNMPFFNVYKRKMRVNGKYKGDIECMFIFEDSLKKGDYGEKIFYDYFKDKLEKQDGIVHDFKIKNTDIYIELKSDYYDIDKTENFFIEKYSDKNRNKYGGPWQALLNNNKYYIYFFVKNKILFIFDTQKLIDKLNNVIEDLEEIDIINQSWLTTGYKVKREVLKDIYTEFRIK